MFVSHYLLFARHDTFLILVSWAMVSMLIYKEGGHTKRWEQTNCGGFRGAGWEEIDGTSEISKYVCVCVCV